MITPRSGGAARPSRHLLARGLLAVLGGGALLFSQCVDAVPGVPSPAVAPSRRRLGQGVFGEAEGLVFTRGYHTATLLEDGRVLVTGGTPSYSADSPAAVSLHRTEIVDPTSGTVVADGSSPGAPGRMNEGRREHTATLLLDGRVLVAGGRGTGANAELFDPRNGSFSTPTAMSHPRWRHTATRLRDGRVLVVGGGGEDGSGSTAEIFEPGASSFRSVAATLSVPRAGHTATLLADGRVFLFGGLASSALQAGGTLFDPADESFGDIGEPSARTGDAATLLADGRVLLVGGNDPFSPDVAPLSALVFDPSSSAIRSLPTRPAQLRFDTRAARLPDGRVLLIGDDGAGGVDSSAELFDPSTETFARLSTGPKTRFGFSVTALRDGRVLVLGGAVGTNAAIYEPATDAFAPTATKPLENRGGGASVALPDGDVLVTGGRALSTLASAEMFSLSSSRYARASDLPSARADHVATLLGDGTVLLTGGSSGQASNGETAFVSSTVRFDPTSGAFTTLVPTTSPRLGHTATRLLDGRVLLVGSAAFDTSASGCGACKVADVVDPGGSTPTEVVPLSYARNGHTATLLADGRVLVAGGATSSATTSQAELYDPASATFAATGPKGPTRSGHSATRLADGRVLLAGGRIATVELFDPVAGSFSTLPNTLSGPRTGHTATLLQDGRVLLAGGAFVTQSASVSTLTAEIVDPVTEVIVETAGRMHDPRFGALAERLPDGRILFVGGIGSPPPEVYDPALDGFGPLSAVGRLDCAGGVAGARCRLTERADGTALLTGGGDGNVVIVSPSGNLSAAPSSLRGRRAHAATTTSTGDVLLVGGLDGDTTLASVERIDASNNAVAQPSLVSARAFASATRLADGRVLVIGGETRQGTAVPTYEILDEGRPSVAAALPTKRSDHAAMRLRDGRVLVAGGVDSADAVLGVDVFDPISAAWTSVGQANLGRRTEAAFLADGSIVFSGEAGAARFAPGTLERLPVAVPTGARLATLATGQLLACRTGCTMLGAYGGVHEAAPVSLQTGDIVRALGASSVVYAGEIGGLVWSGVGDTSPPSARRPVLDPLPGQSFVVGATVKLSGSGFLSSTAPSSVPGVPSAADVAALVFRPLDNTGPVHFVATTQWTDTSVVATLPHTAYTGPGFLSIVVDGVPSEPRLLFLGQAAEAAACETAAACKSGFCVDGVCCDSRCSDGCRACSAKARGDVSPDGVCGPIADGQAPRFGCEPAADNVCGPSGVCDGQGACSLPPRSTRCERVADGFCQGGVCVSAQRCASHGDCPSGEACNASGSCEPATARSPIADPGMCSAAPPGGRADAKRTSAPVAALLLAWAALARRRRSDGSGGGTARRAWWLVGALAGTTSGLAHAQETSPSAAASVAGPPADTKKEEARVLLRRGLALYQTGDYEKALVLFERSRATFPAKGNILNAASALRALGRLDEALEHYEDALATFGATFDDDDKLAVPAAMRDLRAKLGHVRVSANTTGTLVIDGRERGKLPMATAVRLLPGEHTLRVMKDGYRTYEQRLVVRVGDTTEVDARLEALAEAGGLRVEELSPTAADVYVDDVKMGPAPWEGTLAPGAHLVRTQLDDRGSAPVRAIVLQGQTTLLRLPSGPLSWPRRFSVTPATASLRLGDVVLGAGEWTGRLPPGTYTVVASEEGYRSASETFTVAEDGGAPVGPSAWSLVVDEAHPRWPKKSLGSLSIETFVGFGLGASLSGDASTSCARVRCGREGVVFGPSGGLSASFELPVRLSFDIAIGALSLAQRVDRTVPRSATVGPNEGIAYELSDQTRFKGVSLGGGVGYRVALGGRWWLRSRILGGFVFARSSDTIRGDVVTQAGRAPVEAAGSGAEVASTPFFLAPQVGVSVAFDNWRATGSLGVFAVLTQGPKLAHGGLRVVPDCPNQGAPGCVADSAQLQNERGYGVFVVASPQLALSRVF